MSPPQGLTEHHVRGAAWPIGRKVWTAPSISDTPGVAILFLDAEVYLLPVEAARIVEQLQRDGSLPPSVCAFVSHHDAAARHVNFTCQPEYAAFIADDVRDWLLQRNPTVREIVLVGLSLSGLAAAFIATRYPFKFPTAICQSPSFWWDEGRFGKELIPAANPNQRFWICVGNLETDANVSHPPSGLLQKLTQIHGCDAGCLAMRHNEYDVSYRTFDGGHNPKCWRDDLLLALPWATGMPIVARGR